MVEVNLTVEAGNVRERENSADKPKIEGEKVSEDPKLMPVLLSKR